MIGERKKRVQAVQAEGECKGGFKWTLPACEICAVTTHFLEVE